MSDWIARTPRLQTSLVVLVIAALAPVFALVIYISIQSQDASLVKAQKDLLAATKLAALSTERSVEAARHLLNALASTASIKNGDATRCALYFDNLSGKLSAYANAGVLDLQGNITCQIARGGPATNLADRDYFKEVLTTETFVIGGYIVGRITGRASIPFAAPVYDPSGKLSGVAFVTLDLQTMAISNPIEVPPGVGLVVTDRNDFVVAGDESKMSLLGTRFTELSSRGVSLAGAGRSFELPGADGQTYFYAAAPVGRESTARLFVTASIGKDAVLADFRNQLAISLALLTLLTGIGVVGARWIGARTIVVPMRKLGNQVNELGRDEILTNQPITLPDTGNELVELSDAFHRLTEAFQVRKRERDQATELLKIQIDRQLATQKELTLTVHKLTEAQRLAHLGSWELDLTERRLRWSDEVFRIFGVEPHGFAGSYGAFLALVHPDDRAGTDAANRFAINNKLPLDHEYRIVRPSGAIRYVRERGELAFNEGGLPVAITGTILDVTDLRGAQTQAQAADELLSVAHRVADMGSWDMDVVNHQLRFSPEACKLFGLAPDAFDGRYETYLAAVLPEDRELIALAQSRGEPGKKMQDVEYRIRRPDGEIRWMFERGNLTFDKLGKEIRRTGMVMDVTERKQSEAQLRLLGVAVSRLNDMVMITEGGPIDAPGPRIVFVNDAFVRRTGFSRENVLGQSPRILQGPDTDRTQLDCIRRAMEARLPIRTALINYTKDREKFWVELDMVPIVDGGGVCTHWVAVERDITERRQIEMAMLQLNSELEDRVKRRTAQLQASNAELEAFSYSVSHDLRSPLNTIDGFSQLLTRADGERLSDKGKHYLSRIRAGTAQMGQLIDGLLSLAKSASDPLAHQEVDLALIARRVEQECRDREPAREVEVVIPASLIVQGDFLLLSVVIHNLLTNAWKFTAKQAAARIELGSHEDSEGNIFYFISDNGAGFNMAYAEKLFGTFERLHSPSDFPGTGVGLAIVKRVIDRHAGRVWAESEEGKGAVFYFVLPAAEHKGSDQRTEVI